MEESSHFRRILLSLTLVAGYAAARVATVAEVKGRAVTAAEVAIVTVGGLMVLKMLEQVEGWWLQLELIQELGYFVLRKPWLT